ncbi:MAG: hypothetical protein CME63_04145 [Halobacteriovoraceae bacterium]|nr:hypothetical protein [Halobacteriovoraceae bacterium]MBC96914.1 hypothetical protein [Halobacteriovoraceae bacterium]|tara:strand:- start:216537 stop:218060 length:1524 start_codon:yes stop_codon:yes gene_type:complete
MMQSKDYSVTGEQDQISVAILCQDLKVAKSFSEIFKKTGVHPFVCTSLKEFIEITSRPQDLPDLSIVDVKMMSEGNRLFKNIPAIRDELISVAFYCGQDSHALAYSTYDLLSLGMIHEGRSLTGQVKAILKRFNTYQGWQHQAKKALHSESRLDEKLNLVIKRSEELKEKNFYHNFLKNLEARFETEKNADDFLTAAAHVFAGVKEFKRFTFLELSPSGQKLVSPKFIFDKYQEIPSLWLGRTCRDGIEFFAQNMASQVCLEMMGGDLMSLLIKGRRGNPDLMIFIQVDNEDFLAQFDWESFENYLSGVFCYYGWRNQKVEDLSNNRKQSWDLFHEMDDIKFGGLPEARLQGGYERHALIGVDFSDLVDRALSQTEMRFYWKNFIQDFINGLEVQKKLSFTSYQHGVKHLFFRVEKEELEDYLKEIKSYSMRFNYWRYFEDADVILGANLKPDTRVYPMSAQAIESIIAKADKELENTEILKEEEVSSEVKKPASSYFFHPGSEQSM